MTPRAILKRLRTMASPTNAAGMARFGIRPETRALGVSVWDLRKLAKEIGHDHRLARALWASGIHEARILASYVEVPDQVTEAQVDRWVAGFDSWDICDQVVELFGRTPFARKKVREWAGRQEEFIKRAAFSLIADLAVHDKEMTDRELQRYLPVIRRAAVDERNFVKKSVNWALRQIGKRNRALNTLAIKEARHLRESASRSARWIAADALRELTSAAVQARLRR